jgi:hypothetical protein
MRRFRKVASVVALALLATTVGIVAPTPAEAVPQAGGTEVGTWQIGWKWTYARTFSYVGADGTNVSANENVTYTVGAIEVHNGQLAYRLDLSGNVTGGGGSAQGFSLSLKGGSVSGNEWVRVSDLAEIEDHEIQSFTGTAAGLVSISGAFELTLTPDPVWRFRDFRLHAGDTHAVNEALNTAGTFSYDAGSFGSGSGDLGGSSPFGGTASVTSENVSVGIGNVSTLKTNVTDPGGSEKTEWYSDAQKNNAKTHLKMVQRDDTNAVTGTMTLDSSLSSSLLPAPAPTNQISAAVAPDLQCAGGTVTVSGVHGAHQSGLPVQVQLDQDGAFTTVSTTTGAGGAYSANLTAPLQSDGLARPDTRAAWGIVVTSGSIRQAATMEVRPEDCSALTYTGAVTAPQGGSATVSAVLTDTGTGNPVQGATVSFSLTGGGSTSAVTDASGVATATLPVAAGVRSATLTSSYAGSGSLMPATATTAFAVTKDPTQVAIGTTNATAEETEPVQFTATVTPTGPSVPAGASGTVQFFVDSSPLGSPVPLVLGLAQSIPITTLGQGDHTVTATYSGDANYLGSTGGPFTQSIHKKRAVTTTALTSSVNPSVFGQATTLTATVTAPGGGTPTGAVQFKDGSTVVATGTLDGSGVAAVAVDSLAVGGHTLTAVYQSDDDFAVSTSSPVSQTVLQAQTTTDVSVTTASPVAGQPLSYQVAVAPVAPGAGDPTGTVTVTIDGVPGSPQALVGGAVTVNGSGLAAGPHTVSAAYSGSSGFLTSSDSTSFTVAKAATTTVLTSAPDPSAETQVVTLTAAVAPVAPGAGGATGLVTFFDGANPIGSASLSGGQAVLQIDNLSIGSHALTASYGGSSSYFGSTSDVVTQVVNEKPPVIATTMSIAPSLLTSVYGQAVHFTATVTPVDGTSWPTGAVQFSIDGTDFGAPVPLVDGVAVSPDVTDLAAGSHSIIGSYAGDGLFFSSSGDLILFPVKQATTTVSIASSADPSAFGQAVTFTATVATSAPGAGTSGGTVQFRLDGAPLGGPVALVGGQATSPAANGLDPGDHIVSVVSTGDANFRSATGSLTQTVDRIPTTTTLAAAPNPVVYGGPVTLTATVSGTPGTPTGTVTFTDGSTTLGTAPLTTVGGVQKAVLTVPALAAGNHPIVATYAGDVRFAGSSSSAPVTVVVQQATTSITTTPATLLVKLNLLNPVLLAGNITLLTPLSANLRSNGVPVAGQPIKFTAGTTTLCTSVTDSTGTAYCNQLTPTNLLAIVTALGYKATFAGSPNYLPSSQPGSVATIAAFA